MPVCPNCGNQAADNAIFCDQCGTKLAVAAAEAVVEEAAAEAVVEEPVGGVPDGILVCPACGAENVPGEVFCDVCGEPLEAPEPIAVEAIVEEAAAETIVEATPVAEAEIEAEVVVEEAEAEEVVEAELVIEEAEAEEVVEAEPAIEEAEAEEVVEAEVVVEEAEVEEVVEATEAVAEEVYCPTCGAAVNADDTFCGNCGASLTGVAEEGVIEEVPIIEEAAIEDATVAPEAPIEEIVEEEIIEEEIVEPLPVVEEAVVEEAVVEEVIEEAVIEEAEPVTVAQEAHCPVCGAKVQPGQRFCASCGASLTAAEPPAPAPAPTVQPSAAAPPPAAPSGPYLAVVESGAHIPLIDQPELLVGREDEVSGIYPDVDMTPHGGEDGGVSRRHAKLIHEGADWFVVDLDSTNGTYVNEAELAPKARVQISDGDKVSFGDVEAIFHGG